jgi:hypothetical protein
MPLLTLLLALLLLGTWFVFTFVLPAGLGVVHLLLAAGAVLLMRWWVVSEGRERASKGE